MSLALGGRSESAIPLDRTPRRHPPRDLLSMRITVGNAGQRFALCRPFSIWFLSQPGSGRIPRMRRMIDWLVEAFNPAKFPWFRDEFVHPGEFKAVHMGESLTQSFRGLLDRRTIEPNENQQRRE